MMDCAVKGNTKRMKIKKNGAWTGTAVMTGIDQIRNIGIIAHIDAGKTTTSERLLYYSKKINRIGDVDDGTAAMDWMDQERERGITIMSAATTFEWHDHKINLIDTPGHVDFTAEVERSLRVLDGAVGIFCGVAGVQPQSETVWRQSEHYGIPKVIFINKLDRMGADFYRVTKEIEEDLGAVCLILALPVGKEQGFNGIIDIIEEKTLYYAADSENGATEGPVPPERLEEVEFYREKMHELLAETDDTLMEKYLREEPVSIPEIRAAIRKGTLERRFCPVFCGSSLKNKGSLFLLNAIVDYLPSPKDRGIIVGENPETAESEERLPLLEQPFSALAFKVVSDPYFGRLVYLRIYSGRLRLGEKIENWTKEKRERILRILEVHANKHRERDEAIAGDIVAVIGLRSTFTGDTLGSLDAPLILEKIKFPKPVLRMSVEPKMIAEADKVFEALSKLAEEDPTFTIRIDSETGQTIVSGMGQLHIEVLIERMRREYKVEVKLGKPEVAYKETISAEAEGVGKFIRQSGGRGHYGHVVLRIEPLESADFEFAIQLKGEIIPREYFSAIQTGVREAMESGIFKGYPIINVKVTLIDGSFHPVDSNEIAFKIAASMAFKDAFVKASPAILEPIMHIETTLPQEYLGEVLADLSARAGKIEQLEETGSFKIVRGLVPLRTLFDYPTILRSLTQGRASYIIEPFFYQKVQDEELKKIFDGI